MKLRIRFAHTQFFSIATLIAKRRKRQDHERVLIKSKLQMSIRKRSGAAHFLPYLVTNQKTLKPAASANWLGFVH